MPITLLSNFCSDTLSTGDPLHHPESSTTTPIEPPEAGTEPSEAATEAPHIVTLTPDVAKSPTIPPFHVTHLHILKTFILPTLL